jgi:hypothetical protein
VSTTHDNRPRARREARIGAGMPPRGGKLDRDQYESELITSPPARVPSCHQVVIEIELLMN